MNFSLASLVPNILFSIIGLYLFRHAKKEVNYPVLFISVALMFYAYLISSVLWLWLIGIGLCFMAYQLLK